jgi:hypothetical protein
VSKGYEPWKFHREMIPNADVFYLFDNGGIVVSDKVRDLVRNHGLQNIEMEHLLDI